MSSQVPEIPPPKRPPSRSYPRRPAPQSSPNVRPYRFALRLVVIPAIAVAGVFIYSGLRDYMVLPTCDSSRARQTLSEVLKQLKLEPTRYEPLTTVSSTKENVVCNAVLPLPDGANVSVDYSFYWQGSKANMKYAVSRKAP